MDKLILMEMKILEWIVAKNFECESSPSHIFELN